MHLGRAWRFFGVPGLAGLFAIALVVLAIGHLYSGTIHDHAFAEARKEAMRVALRVERDAGEAVTTSPPQRLRRAVRRAVLPDEAAVTVVGGAGRSPTRAARPSSPSSQLQWQPWRGPTAAAVR